MKYHWLIVVLICISDTYSSQPNDFDNHIITKRSLRSPKTATDGPYLPHDVTPTGYHVWLQPVPQDGFFKGQVEVNISCLSPTNNIILHAGANLNIGKAEISVIKPRETTGGGRQINSVSVQRVRRSSPEDWCEVTLSNKLQQGVFYQLTLEFSSYLSNKSSETGIYWGVYDKDKFEDRWFIAADMQGNKARKVFPCFDEFPYKASFAISIGRPEEMRSLSNMALQRSEKMMDQPKWMWDHFETSPPMSPFSVNIFAFDPEVIVPVAQRDDLGSTILHMYGPTDVHDGFQDAGDKILQTVEKIETYLRTRYPLPDLQIVVSPGIESRHIGFGLLIFSDYGGDYDFWSLKVLFDIADQWLVHLTTPHFWSETLFGNAIAQYVSTVGFLETLKGYKYTELFNWPTLYTMVLTSGSATNYNTPFDNVVGVWLLRMLNYTLSENTLRSGLNSFLYDRSYKTFVLDHFLAALGEQARRDWALPSGVTVPDIVKSWLDVKQFPIVTVFRNYKTRTAYVEQQLHVLNKSAILPERVKNHLWYLPLTLLQSNQPQERFWNIITWMKGERAVTLENMPSSDIFIIINPENAGLFLVNYDPTNWGLITKHLTTDRSSLMLSAATRSKLLADAFSLAHSGELSFSVPLNMSFMLRDETDFGPWHTFIEYFLGYNYMLQKTRILPIFQEYAQKIAKDLYEQYGGFSGKSESPDETSVQNIVETIMCQTGAEDCIDALSAQFDPGNNNCIVLQWGSYEIWNKALLWALGHNENRHLDKNYLGRIAYCTQDKERMNELLEAVLLKYAISDEDMLDIIDRISNPYLLFDYVSDKWFEIKKKYGHKQNVLKSLVHKTTSTFTTSDGYDLVTGFYVARKRDTPSVLPAVTEALEMIVENSKWYDRSLPQIESWIRRFLRDN